MSIDASLSRLFRHEEINGAGRCPTYLHRWTLFQPRRPRAFWRGFGIYLHKFVGDDWSRDLHDHPKRFISIGLKGAYVEETPSLAAIELDDQPMFYPCGCSHLKVEYGLCDVYSNKTRIYRNAVGPDVPGRAHPPAVAASRSPALLDARHRAPQRARVGLLASLRVHPLAELRRERQHDR